MENKIIATIPEMLSDVVGWLDNAEVIDICRKIKELPPA